MVEFNFGLIFLLISVLLLVVSVILLLHWFKKKSLEPLALKRFKENPILSPEPTRWWESEAVFNPAAFVDKNQVHLFYRALGGDGISRIGYASSSDGIHFKRLAYPVYDRGSGFVSSENNPGHRVLSYNTDTYASGGGWGGCEDPRVVKIDNHAYMTFGAFEGWQSIRLAVASISLPELYSHIWKWSPQILMSPQNETHKNWVLFPEKINGHFAILHALTPKIMIEYLDSFEKLQNKPIKSNNHRGGHPGSWDTLVRGAGAPPIKTKYGWLLLYHGMSNRDSVGYKVGVMLLDLKDPTKVLYRSKHPILTPTEWYENDWKPGVVYASGAVVFKGDLIVYYGGGDKYVAAAKINLNDFLHKLKSNQHAVLQPVKV